MLSALPRRSGVGPWLLPRGAGFSSLSAVSPRPLERSKLLVLPYLGGGFVRSPARRFRVLGRLAPGWYRFRVEGAEAIALEVAEPEGLEQLPSTRGYLVGTWFFAARVRCQLHLTPQEPSLDLSPCVARRLPGGAWLFDHLALLEEHEEKARDALDEGASWPAGSESLREAYGFALLWRLCRRLGIPATPWGLRGQLTQVAATGKQGAFDLLAPCVSLAPLHGVDEIPPGGDDDGLVEPVLAASGAVLLGTRRLGDDLLEVRFRFLERSMACVVERPSLRVIDAGVCLDGRDGRLSLACLPSVLREAITAGKVVVTRRAGTSQ